MIEEFPEKEVENIELLSRKYLDSLAASYGLTLEEYKDRLHVGFEEFYG